MAKVRQTTTSNTTKTVRPALTPEARENQLIALAVDVAEQQLLNGTASSQVITHFLKLATAKEKLELERLKGEIKLQEAKTEQVKSMKRSEELMEEAIKAFRIYNGQGDSNDDY